MNKSRLPIAAALAAAATLVCAAPALAYSAPSAPTGAYIDPYWVTKTTLNLQVRSACDPDGDFGVGVGGSFEFQLNGVTYSTQPPQQPNCVTDTTSSFGTIYGYGPLATPLK